MKVRVKKASKANNATETRNGFRQPAATAAVSPSASPATTTPSTNPATTTPTKNPDGFEPVLFKNATFENGTDDFVSRGSSKVSQADNGYEGKCLYVSGRTDTWNGAAIDVTSTIVPGAKYHVTAYMKQMSGAAAEIKCSAQTGSDYRRLQPLQMHHPANGENWKARSKWLLLSRITSFILKFREVRRQTFIWIRLLSRRFPKEKMLWIRIR